MHWTLVWLATRPQGLEQPHIKHVQHVSFLPCKFKVFQGVSLDCCFMLFSSKRCLHPPGPCNVSCRSPDCSQCVNSAKELPGRWSQLVSGYRSESCRDHQRSMVSTCFYTCLFGCCRDIDCSGRFVHTSLLRNVDSCS